MRRARESFQGPRRDRRRVQGDRPGPDRGPQVHGMGSVHALVRRGLVARGMALRRLHDRRIRPAGSLRSDFPRVHDHVHPVGPDRLHCRGQRCVVRLPAPTGVRFAGEQAALRLLPLFWLRVGRRERLHRRDLDVVRLQSHARVAGCVPHAGWLADQLLPRSIDPFDLLPARAVRHGRPSGDSISELGIHRGPRRIGSLCVVHRPEGFRLRTALGVAADATPLIHVHGGRSWEWVYLHPYAPAPARPAHRLQLDLGVHRRFQPVRSVEAGRDVGAVRGRVPRPVLVLLRRRVDDRRVPGHCLSRLGEFRGNLGPELQGHPARLWSRCLSDHPIRDDLYECGEHLRLRARHHQHRNAVEDVDAEAPPRVLRDCRPARDPPAVRDELRVHLHFFPRLPRGDCRASVDPHPRRLLPREGAPLHG